MMNKSDVFNKRILEPCLTMYEKTIIHLNGDAKEKAKLLADKKAKIENEDIFAIPRLTMLCNNKCTLQCKECTVLVGEYANNPHIADPEQIIAEGDMLLAGVDECYTLSIASGEIFIYPHLEKVLEHYINHPKVFLIELMSNGTVLPDEKLIPLLKNKKVLIELSDYGHIEKLAKFIAFTDKNDINITVCSLLNWTASGGFEKRNKSTQQLKEEFFNCSIGLMCKSLLKGKLYHCSRGAFTADLIKKNDFDESECVEIVANPKEMREKLKNFYMCEQMCLCDYCDFGAINPISAKTAEQPGGELRKSKFTPVIRTEYEELINWSRQLQEGKNWLEEQYNNHIEYIKQLEEAKEWLAEQYENYKKLYEESINKGN